MIKKNSTKVIIKTSNIETKKRTTEQIKYEDCFIQLNQYKIKNTEIKDSDQTCY